ncbi:hypothetical protein MJO29_002651 [Puccinia striiformis f. sp. tritici]|nr:hypothetical protein MJO29_002651 [Puccinia striiformis f. sp. tritici]
MEKSSTRTIVLTVLGRKARPQGALPISNQVEGTGFKKLGAALDDLSSCLNSYFIDVLGPTSPGTYSRISNWTLQVSTFNIDSPNPNTQTCTFHATS